MAHNEINSSTIYYNSEGILIGDCSQVAFTDIANTKIDVKALGAFAFELATGEKYEESKTNMD